MMKASIRALAALLVALLALSAFPRTSLAEGPNGVAVRNLAKPGAFEVTNSGGPAMLSYEVRLQRLQNGAWSDETADIELVRQCNIPRPGPCVPLSAGETLRPPPWNWLGCGSQCAAGCRANAMLPPGTFRFGVSACQGGGTTFGPPFQMNGSR